MSWFSRKNLRLSLISFFIFSIIALNFIFFFFLGESGGGEYEYHEINHLHLKRYFPKRNFNKTSDRFGYYLGNIDRVTYNYTETPLPLNEKIDCRKHNEEYVQVMKKMGILVDIDERRQKYHISQSDVSYLEKWNENVFEHMNNFYSQFCPFHQLRQKRRLNEKTEVEWKKNDTVVIYYGKQFRSSFGSKWVKDKFLNKYSDCGNGLKYKVTKKRNLKSQSHIRIYNLKDVLDMKGEIFDGGSIFDHYSVFFTLESPREDKHPESMFLKILENFDFILSYLPFSELPIYYDNDLPLLLLLRKNENVQKIYGYKEDRYKTYEELREETIHFISTVHKQGEEICTHISNCHAYHFHSYLEYRFFDGDGGMFRTNIIRNLNSDPDLNVINYGTCSYLGKKRTIQNLEKIFSSGKMDKKFSKQLETNLHPFHLSFENKMLDNYSTEKLFGGILSKYSVPIYFGDPFIYQKFTEGFLEKYKVFIDVNDFVSPTALNDYLKYLLRNQTAYLEYFEWRFQKVWEDNIIPKVVRPGAFEDFVDDGGKNVSPWCRITERFVKERMEYYQESTQ